MTFKSFFILEYLTLRSTSQSSLYLRKTALYTHFCETAVVGFESEETSENSGDDKVIRASHLTNSSSDSDYEVPNVEQKNNEKDVEDYVKLLEVVEQQQTGGLLSMDFT